MKVWVTLLLEFIFASGFNTYACKCNGPGTVKASYASSDLIVSGRVISRELVSFVETIQESKVERVRAALKDDTQKLRLLETDYIYKVEIEVSEKFKGEDIPDTLVIYTAMNSASCGYRFEKDQTYLIYADKESYFRRMFLSSTEEVSGLEKEDAFWTNHCTRTVKYNNLEAKELRELMVKER